MGKLRLATVWLGGCSGCHMSFLDLDEWLIDLASKADVVFSPIMDAKTYPDEVDVALAVRQCPPKLTHSPIGGPGTEPK